MKVFLSPVDIKSLSDLGGPRRFYISELPASLNPVSRRFVGLPKDAASKPSVFFSSEFLSFFTLSLAILLLSLSLLLWNNLNNWTNSNKTRTRREPPLLQQLLLLLPLPTTRSSKGRELERRSQSVWETRKLDSSWLFYLLAYFLLTNERTVGHGCGSAPTRGECVNAKTKAAEEANEGALPNSCPFKPISVLYMTLCEKYRHTIILSSLTAIQPLMPSWIQVQSGTNHLPSCLWFFSEINSVKDEACSSKQCEVAWVLNWRISIALDIGTTTQGGWFVRHESTKLPSDSTDSDPEPDSGSGM